MNHRLPFFALCRSFLLSLGFGLLAGLTVPVVSAAPAMDTPRFTDNKNGTVTDNWTGLVWLQNANCTETVGGVGKSSGLLTWADALIWTAALASGSCGLDDGSTAGQWRLPNRNELQSLIDYTAGIPLPASHPFTSVQSFNQSYYWSSTTFASNPSNAWHVSFSDGVVDTHGKADTDFVWPVRGGL